MVVSTTLITKIYYIVLKLVVKKWTYATIASRSSKVGLACLMVWPHWSCMLVKKTVNQIPSKSVLGYYFGRFLAYTFVKKQET